jgi:site-specific DNA-cytosine methylase
MCRSGRRGAWTWEESRVGSIYPIVLGTPMPTYRSADSPLTVGDLFCGAGGFAEGFRQAGFKIAWGVDLWQPAVETFKRNFTGARDVPGDLLEIDPSELSPVDVLIGSPPCVHFSPANRGGGGDREAGMKLVRRYLEFVRALSPRYWVMENVPALRQDLRERMEGTLFAEDGVRIAIPRMEVLDASSYGTPQSRQRLFSGSFPLPPTNDSSTGSDGTPLRTIVETLPDPTGPRPRGSTRVTDPVYAGLEVQVELLRDHFEDPRWALTGDDVESTKDHRAHDRIYGVMPFPDDLDKPARTITATKTRGSRATVVIPWPSRKDVPYRTLTLRECASAQGFPLNYQFWADSMSAKDFLVGNAVPPPLARSIAHAILAAEGRSPPEKPLLSSSPELPPLVEFRPLGSRHFSMRRRFRGSVDIDWRRDHRLELDNQLATTRSRVPPDMMPPVVWRPRLYLGYATLYRCYEPKLRHALGIARAMSSGPNPPVSQVSLSGMMLSLTQAALNGFPDGFELQEQWSGLRPIRYGPWQVLSLVNFHVGRAFPASEWAGRTVPMDITGPTLEECATSFRGDEATDEQPFDASVRLIAATIGLALLCERINEGVARLESLHSALTSPRGLMSRRVDSLTELNGATRTTRAKPTLVFR